jgi:hypothetical protein
VEDFPGRERTLQIGMIVNDLKEQGWKRTVYRDREVLLVSPDKVHFRIRYTRERADGTVITEYENIWILIYKNNRWGIELRSY